MRTCIDLLLRTFGGCAQEALWVNFLIVYVCGLVVGKLTSSVVGGTDSVYWLHSSSAVGGRETAADIIEKTRE